MGGHSFPGIVSGVPGLSVFLIMKSWRGIRLRAAYLIVPESSFRLVHCRAWESRHMPGLISLDPVLRVQLLSGKIQVSAFPSGFCVLEMLLG